MVARARLVILEFWTPLTLTLRFNHPLVTFFASKAALLVQHEDPSRTAQAENEKSQYYSSSNHTLRINFPPASFPATFFPAAFFAPASFVPALHHIAANRTKAHPIFCSAGRLATLRVPVSTLTKARGAWRFSDQSAYCRPIGSTLLSYRTLCAQY